MGTKALELFDKSLGELEGVSDDVLSNIQANTPWQDYSNINTKVDEDGFKILGQGSSETLYYDFQTVQQQCWDEFNLDVFVSTTICDRAGRLTGYGFDITSSESKLQKIIAEIWEDPRNDLICNFKKYIVRSEVQGELFLVFTLHASGFVEIDFLSPTTIKGGKDNSGVISHPDKPMMPLMYRVETTDPSKVFYIPSINLAYYPELWDKIDGRLYDKGKVIGKGAVSKFKKTKGYTKFVVAYDQGNVTKRNISKVKSVLKWLSLYSQLKLWEIDHKKSSGAYLWTVEMEDKAALRTWLSMTEEQQQATGITAKKTPGGTLMLPPGFKLVCTNPKLSSISDQDNDILRMISAGLNVPDDVMTGSSSGTTYGGAKESRGPLSDRTTDSMAELERYLKFHFWRGVFFLTGTVTKMPKTYKVNEASNFDSKKPKFRVVNYPAHKMVEIDFPTSEISNLESKAKALLGVKHGPVSEQLGIPLEDVSRALGFNSYRVKRLRRATEEATYPKLETSAEIEQAQAINGERGLEPKPPTKPEPPDKKGE